MIRSSPSVMNAVFRQKFLEFFAAKITTVITNDCCRKAVDCNLMLVEVFQLLLWMLPHSLDTFSPRMDQHSQYEFFPMVGLAIPPGSSLFIWQLLHVRTLFSKSLSMFGHQRSFLLDFSAIWQSIVLKKSFVCVDCSLYFLFILQ
jgi:hypothetical protein